MSQAARTDVYLDNAATTFPKAPGVVEAVADFLTNGGGSPARGGHRRSLEASRALFRTREALAELFGVGASERVVFTSNATEALNLAVRGLARPGLRIVTTDVEHNALRRPLRLAEAAGAAVVAIPTARADDDAVVDAFARVLSLGADLVAVQHASNVNGRVLPIARIGEVARRRGALLLVDAAQTAGVVPINVGAMSIDLLAFTGHKGLLGPQGTGGLVVGERASPEPLITGGTGSQSELESQPAVLPDRYESGTPNGPGIAGLGAAIRYVAKEGVDALGARDRARAEALREGLRAIRGVRLIEAPRGAETVGVVSFSIDGADPAAVGLALDADYGVQARAGLHCAPAAHRALGTFPHGTVRLSPGPFTTEGDVARAIDAVRDLAERRRDDVAL